MCTYTISQRSTLPDDTALSSSKSWAKYNFSAGQPCSFSAGALCVGTPMLRQRNPIQLKEEAVVLKAALLSVWNKALRGHKIYLVTRLLTG